MTLYQCKHCKKIVERTPGYDVRGRKKPVWSTCRKTSKRVCLVLVKPEVERGSR